MSSPTTTSTETYYDPHFVKVLSGTPSTANERIEHLQKDYYTKAEVDKLIADCDKTLQLLLTHLNLQ